MLLPLLLGGLIAASNKPLIVPVLDANTELGTRSRGCSASPLKIRVSHEILAGGSCPIDTTEQSVELELPDGGVTSVITREWRESQPALPRLTASCDSNSVVLSDGVATVRFDIDAEHRISLAADTQAALRRELSADATALARLKSTQALLRWAVVDRSVAELALASARVAAGDWARVDAQLVDPLTEAADLRARRKALRQQLAARRSETQPLRVVDFHEVGSVATPINSVAPFADAQLFWADGLACVSSGTVLPAASSAGVGCVGPAEKMLHTPGRELAEEQHDTVEVEVGGCSRVLGARQPDSSSYAPLAIHDDVLVYATEQGVFRAEKKRPVLLTAREASVEVGRGTGGPLLGNGHYVLLWAQSSRDLQADEFLELGGTRTWHLLPPPPKGLRWEHVVVSPDQKHVAAVARDQDPSSSRLFVGTLTN